MHISLHDRPALVRVFVGDNGLVAERRDSDWQAAGVTVTISSAIRVHAPRAELSRIAITWAADFPEQSMFLGDAWERSYGDLQWRPAQPERILPWYFAAHDPTTGDTVAAGVKTQPGAMCFWTVSSNVITLWLDFRNGGSTCVPGDRVIDAATIVTQSSEADKSPGWVIGKLCAQMCEKPRLARRPVCGNNNWYYAYGQNFDADQVRRDAGLLAELAGSHSNRPYCVIDAGWSPGGGAPGGPWTASLPDKFPSMPRLAEDIRKVGVLPGIWIRPTALSVVNDPRRLRQGPQRAAEKALDITMPENLELIHADVHRMHEWGFGLIKHDFSTFDAFGRWGFDMSTDFTDGGWHFADRSLTNAEIFLRLYRTIRDAAGDSVLIGCNTIGHIAAGLFELQRTGDDTSGRMWERTRRMGVNTLAYRLPQNGTFFTVDADCAPHTEFTPWDKDRQWLDLVARSGTALFVSVDPRKITREVKSAMTAAMQLALSGGSRIVAPLDWLTSTTPQHWRFDGQDVHYDWLEPGGARPFRA